MSTFNIGLKYILYYRFRTDGHLRPKTSFQELMALILKAPHMPAKGGTWDRSWGTYLGHHFVVTCGQHLRTVSMKKDLRDFEEVLIWDSSRQYIPRELVDAFKNDFGVSSLYKARLLLGEGFRSLTKFLEHNDSLDMCNFNFKLRQYEETTTIHLEFRSKRRPQSLYNPSTLIH